MAYYEDFEKIDKICPLLSSKQVVKDDGVLYCLGENCMLFQNYCKPKTITLTQALFNGMMEEK